MRILQINMLTNNQTLVKKMSMRRECKTLEAPRELKLFISGANLDNSELCYIDVHCKAFLKGNSFVLEIVWSLLTKIQITHGYTSDVLPRAVGEYLIRIRYQISDIKVNWIL